MKIKYKFANGEVKYVEVNDEVGAEILKSRRIEENGDRKERYHCYSIAGLDYEGDEFADKDTPESLLLNKEEEGVLQEFMETLTEVQKRRLQLRIEGLTLTDIAREEGVEFNPVKRTFLQISKKFQIFLENRGQFCPLKSPYSEGAL